jgi:hypothetical protein
MRLTTKLVSPAVNTSAILLQAADVEAAKAEAVKLLVRASQLRRLVTGVAAGYYFAHCRPYLFCLCSKS